MKKSPWVFGLGGLLAIVMFMVGRVSTQVGATPAKAREPSIAPAAVQVRSRALTGTTPQAAPHRRSVAATIAGSARLLDGLTEAQRIFGPRHPDLISAAVESMLICSSEPSLSEWAGKDARMGLNPGWEDPQKIWAIDRLQAWCEGFDGRAFYGQLDLSQRRPISNAMELTSKERVPAARQVLRSSVDTFHLVTAGRVMLHENRLPLREIFQGEPPLGPFELSGPWSLAASLSTCARQLGCGPDSPLTAFHCAQAGCAYGVTYEQALADSLPPRDYQSIVAFRNWIVRQHAR